MTVKRRRNILIGVVVATLMFGAGGFTATWWVRSPQQLAAEAAAPAATDLTAPVEKRVLQQSVVLRGDVAAGQTFPVTPAPRDGGKAVVTGLKVKQGGLVEAGTVLLEVGGRPLFALPGAKPAYRDLRPGYTGPDVAQLQAALKALGRDPQESNGVFGEGTKRALTTHYTALGYLVIPTGPDDDKQLAASDKQVLQAQRGVDDATDPVLKARAVEDLKEAKKSREELRQRTGPILPMSEYVFLPSFPARVEGLKAEIGGEVSAPLITLSSGELRVRSLLGQAQQAGVKPGMPVEILAETQGATARGAVTSVGELQTDKAQGTSGYPMLITPSTPLAATLAGQNVRVTVTAAATAGEVLVVPLSALFASADGKVHVVRRGADGARERLEVTAGMSADGYVEVRGALTPGDRVIIGVPTR
ncbi:peptidoglycan-binding protein [Longispora sp. NPDC051575]|uniref:efflux RND transporter periplasmic adaptor subunit n=1 Tax=Longispora sp. NPDC051575 TaxID=3154943 RepID=UPI003438F6C9